jgi:hypothetical protein
MKLPVRGTNFVKDTTTGALLTVNPSVLAENEARKRSAQSRVGKRNLGLPRAR